MLAWICGIHTRMHALVYHYYLESIHKEKCDHNNFKQIT